jgi:succinate dehydrogenase / fumarate reductase cytochrome b subunit
MGLLCLHLSHGVSSMFQSLGWKSQQYSKCLDGFAKGAAVIIFAGNCSSPLAVLFGLIQ